jgi:hypothetical protein
MSLVFFFPGSILIQRVCLPDVHPYRISISSKNIMAIFIQAWNVILFISRLVFIFTDKILQPKALALFIANKCLRLYLPTLP